MKMVRKDDLRLSQNSATEKYTKTLTFISYWNLAHLVILGVLLCKNAKVPTFIKIFRR